MYFSEKEDVVTVSEGVSIPEEKKAEFEKEYTALLLKFDSSLNEKSPYLNRILKLKQYFIISNEKTVEYCKELDELIKKYVQ